MPMEYRGGDLVQVDYSGDGLSYTDHSSGKIVNVDLFCCCWALSSYSYADATESQKKRDFTQSHVRAFRYFGVCSHGLVPDNLKSAVSKPHAFDPQINPLYGEFARYYGIAVLPARIRKPKDKAKVESAVLHIQRFILARLRNRQFFSLAEVNKAIAELLEEFNDRPMKDYGNQSRRERFERLDQPHAQQLPTEPFRIVDVKPNILVGKNYHIRYDDHFYSVPFQLVGQRVTAKRNGMMVEVVHDNRTIARHLYSTEYFRFTTQGAHMPKEHQFVKGLTPGWIVAQAAKIGENAVNAVSIVMRRCEHVQQGFNSALGVLSFAKAYPPERVEAACGRCLHYNSVSYRALKSILEHNLDQQPLTGVPAIRRNVKKNIMHENLRRNFGQNKSEE
jgi:transposase